MELTIEKIYDKTDQLPNSDIYDLTIIKKGNNYFIKECCNSDSPNCKYQQTCSNQKSVTNSEAIDLINIFLDEVGVKAGEKVKKS